MVGPFEEDQSTREKCSLDLSKGQLVAPEELALDMVAVEVDDTIVVVEGDAVKAIVVVDEDGGKSEGCVGVLATVARREKLGSGVFAPFSSPRFSSSFSFGS